MRKTVAKTSESLGNIVSLALSTGKAQNTSCVYVSMHAHRCSHQITSVHRHRIRFLPLYLHAPVLNSLAALFDEFLEQLSAERIGWVTFDCIHLWTSMEELGFLPAPSPSAADEGISVITDHKSRSRDVLELRGRGGARWSWGAISSGAALSRACLSPHK